MLMNSTLRRGARGLQAGAKPSTAARTAATRISGRRSIACDYDGERRLQPRSVRNLQHLHAPLAELVARFPLGPRGRERDATAHVGQEVDVLHRTREVPVGSHFVAGLVVVVRRVVVALRLAEARIAADEQ